MAALSTAAGAPSYRAAGGRIALRWSVLLILGIYFLLPLFAMLEFSTRGVDGRSGDAWRGIFTDPDLVAGLSASLGLSLLTVGLMFVLLFPTLAWVHLRAPGVRRLIEFLCLLPLTIPAIVLVAGVAPIYRWVTYFLGESPLTLTFVYTILALPYAYRSIEAGFGAIDVKTLADAARSLGSSWTGVIVRILLPNMRAALLSAAVISVALVLGEFTISSLLNFNTLQVVINLLGKRDAALSVAVSLAALLFVFVLLLLISTIGRGRTLAPLAPEKDEAA